MYQVDVQFWRQSTLVLEWGIYNWLYQLLQLSVINYDKLNHIIKQLELENMIKMVYKVILYYLKSQCVFGKLWY